MTPQTATIFEPERAHRTAAIGNRVLRRTRQTFTLLGLVVAVSVLAACSDEAVDSPPPMAPPSASKPAIHRIEWLRVTDNVSPDQWLASRRAAREIDLYDPATKEMRAVLEDAARHYRDHPRMIANRAVQLEGMLKEKDISERAHELIVALSGIPGEGRHVESFSAMTQQYYNLRLEGLDHAGALQALKANARE